MLKLSAAHLREQRRKDPKKRLVWLDIGGGTGDHLSVFKFSTISLIASRVDRLERRGDEQGTSDHHRLWCAR